MDHLIERMRRAGCTDIRVVTRPEKSDVVAHAERRGLTVIRAHPRSVSESLLAGLCGTDPTDVALFGFPDTVWDPLDGFMRLLGSMKGFEVALGLFEGREPRRSDVVQVDDAGLVTSITVKPDAPSSNLTWGCAAARRRALDGLSEHPEPGVVLNSICAKGQVVGVTLSGPFVDIGTPEALHEVLRGLSDRSGQGT